MELQARALHVQRRRVVVKGPRGPSSFRPPERIQPQLFADVPSLGRERHSESRQRPILFAL